MKKNSRKREEERIRIQIALAVVAATTLVLCTLVCAAAAVQVSVVPSSQSVAPGENFTVDVYVDPEVSAIGGVDYILRFNNSLLNATSLTQGAFFSGFSTYQFGEINNTLGTVDYGESILGGGSVSSPGALTTITFQAIALHGLDELYFQKVTVSDPEGYKIPANTSCGSVRIGLCGDVNNDNRVTMGDGRRIYMNLLYGDGEYPIDNPWAADVNCDTRITMGDGRKSYMNLLYGAEQYPLECCG